MIIKVIFSILIFISRFKLVILIDCDLSSSLSSFKYLINLYKNEMDSLVPKLLSQTPNPFLDGLSLKSTYLRESITNSTISNEFHVHIHKIAHSRDFYNNEEENTLKTLIFSIQIQYNYMERFNSKKYLKDISEVGRGIIREFQRIMEQQKTSVNKGHEDINSRDLKQKVIKLENYYILAKFLINFESKTEEEEYEKFKLGSGMNLVFDNLHFS